MNNEYYYNTLPIGRENAITYSDLCVLWGMKEREVRKKLHQLSLFDSGDNYVLIRSSHGKGFYLTDDIVEIKIFKNECIKKAKSNFAPLSKINRILLNDTEELQASIFNNLRNVRIAKGLLQSDVVNYINDFDASFDIPMLSKFENSFCLPTPYQLCKLAELYGCKTNDLILIDNNMFDLYV